MTYWIKYEFGRFHFLAVKMHVKKIALTCLDFQFLIKKNLQPFLVSPGDYSPRD